MADWFQEFFLDPINSHAGYNLVNTLVYAGIALLAAFLLYHLITKILKVSINRRFLLAVIPFILLGSTARVVTDSVDTGVMQQYIATNPTALFTPLFQFLLNTHWYDYRAVSGPLDVILSTHSPGIYFLTGGFTILSLLVAWFLAPRVAKLNLSFSLPQLGPCKPFPLFSTENAFYSLFALLGLLVWLPHLLVLVPFMHYWAYPLMGLALATIAGATAWFVFKRLNVDPWGASAVFAHALDGAATFLIIDVFNKLEPLCTQLGKCYGEQHVVSRGLGEMLGFTGYGFALFFLVKVLFSGGAAYLVCREAENENEKYYILLLLVIFGLAPGVRDLLRVLYGA